MSASDTTTLPPRWLTRAMSLFVNAGFLLLAALVFTNEDPLPPQGRPVMICLGLAMLASFAAWRWARLGGLATLAAAGALWVAVIVSSLVTGLGGTGLVLSLIYPLPYVVLGSLALLDAGSAARPA